MANKVSIQKATQQLAATPTEVLLQEVLKNSPKFASYCPEGTQQRLTETGVEALSKVPEAQNEFFGTLMRVFLEKADVERARNPFEDIGLLEYWDAPEGEIAQRIAVQSVAPISPQYKNLQDGSWVNQDIIRKPKLSERFFPMNYDLQNLVTLQEYNFKRILLQQGYAGAITAGIMQGMDTGRIILENTLVKYLINKTINSEDHPLQSTQVIEVPWASSLDSVTDEQFLNFLIAISDIFGSMFALDCPATGAFNAANFKTRVERDQYVMLARTGIKNRINKKILAGAFNPDRLNLDIDSVYDENDFGGLVPYAEEDYTTQLYPIFGPLGDTTDYYISEANAATAVSAGTLTASTVNVGGAISTFGYKLTTYPADASAISGAVTGSDVYFKDNNSDVIAVIAQRGIMGIHRQNSYEIRPHINNAGLYNNFWAAAPNNGLYTDFYYNLIVIKAQATE